jgi:hypothetical protein
MKICPPWDVLTRVIVPAKISITLWLLVIAFHQSPLETSESFAAFYGGDGTSKISEISESFG